ncbi:FUSC family protein [Microbacterium sp. SORGH_AS_0888]|uniref:FUSC family protein n=1 Tax=Microbacterium sp. SORGH_AS_0888 TaxID=3041791 RepID=UPI00278088F6|nr:FUSC family protein [Microbacterium sp. SORGH_AS_0888]MDQ1130042.1 MFS family permease [Microbacterium sp. SORGH_AS_0888]
MTGGSPSRLLRAAREATTTMVAAAVAALVGWAVDPEPGTIVFALFLAISLSRSQLERDARGRVEAGIAVPLVALAGCGVGMVLAASPVAGAALFTAGLTASVLLRRVGEAGRRVGGLIALPFTVLLVAPVGGPSLTPLHRLAVAILVGLVAWAAVTGVQITAQRAGMLPRAAARPSPRPGEREARRRPARRDASVRLAVQMAVMLTVAFGVGVVSFREHWAWIVLTGLLVTLGNAGRADVVYKGVQRVVGAGAGSLLVFVLPLPLPASWALTVVAVALFAGLVLRPFGYVWWALSVTMALAVAQSFGGAGFELWQRWAEIVLGAVIAIGVSWLVLPVRSEDVVRRRVAQVLAALADELAAWSAAAGAGAGEDSSRRRVADARRAMDRAVAPFEAARRLSAGAVRPRPCGWADAARSVCDALARPPRPGVRAALGRARRAAREPATLQAALDDLCAAATG